MSSTSYEEGSTNVPSEYNSFQQSVKAPKGRGSLRGLRPKIFDSDDSVDNVVKPWLLSNPFETSENPSAEVYRRGMATATTSRITEAEKVSIQETRSMIELREVIITSNERFNPSIQGRHELIPPPAVKRRKVHAGTTYTSQTSEVDPSEVTKVQHEQSIFSYTFERMLKEADKLINLSEIDSKKKKESVGVSDNDNTKNVSQEGSKKVEPQDDDRYAPTFNEGTRIKVEEWLLGNNFQWSVNPSNVPNPLQTRFSCFLKMKRRMGWWRKGYRSE